MVLVAVLEPDLRVLFRKLVPESELLHEGRGYHEVTTTGSHFLY